MTPKKRIKSTKNIIKEIEKDIEESSDRFDENIEKLRNMR